MRKLIWLLVLAGLAFLSFTVKCGDYTFAQHVVRIWKSDETQDLVKGVKKEAGPLANKVKEGALAGWEGFKNSGEEEIGPLKLVGFYKTDGKYGFRLYLWNAQSGPVGVLEVLEGELAERMVAPITEAKSSGKLLSFEARFDDRLIQFDGESVGEKVTGTFVSSRAKEGADPKVARVTLTKCCAEAPLQRDFASSREWAKEWKALRGR